MGALAGTKIDIIIKTVFAAWREMFLEMQLELQVSKLKEENLRLMLAVCEQETELTWVQEAHQELVQLSQEKEMKMSEDIMKLKLSGNLKEQRIISQTFGAQGVMLMKVMFSAWRDFRTDAMMQYEKNEMVRLKSQSMATKSKKDESAQRMLMKLVVVHFLWVAPCFRLARSTFRPRTGVSGSEEAHGISRVRAAGCAYKHTQRLSLGGSDRRGCSVVSLERASPGVGGSVVLPLSVSVGLALE